MNKTGDYIVLKPYSLSDTEDLTRIANNAQIAGNMRDMFPHPYTVQDAENYIKLRLEDRIQSVFGIIYNGELAGSIGLHLQQDVYRLSAELGYFVGEPYWNKGIATQAIALITRYGFENLHLNRIFARVFANNKASMRVLEKNNYVLEGIKKKAIVKNNRILDEYFYAKIYE